MRLRFRLWRAVSRGPALRGKVKAETAPAPLTCQRDARVNWQVGWVIHTHCLCPGFIPGPAFGANLPLTVGPGTRPGRRFGLRKHRCPRQHSLRSEKEEGVRGRTLADRLAKSVGWPAQASRAMMFYRPVRARLMAQTYYLASPPNPFPRRRPIRWTPAGASRRVFGGCPVQSGRYSEPRNRFPLSLEPLRAVIAALWPASRTLTPLPVLRDIPVPARFR